MLSCSTQSLEASVPRFAVSLSFAFLVAASAAHAGSQFESVTTTQCNPCGFWIGRTGCPMAHCDRAMSDQVRLRVPGPRARILWRDQFHKRSLYGLGCSSNSRVAACTFFHLFKPNLVVYDFDGNIKWDSGSLLGPFAATSAPIVAIDGSVIAADASKLIRFDNDGNVIWKTRTPGGIPISPVITRSGIVILV